MIRHRIGTLTFADFLNFQLEMKPTCYTVQSWIHTVLLTRANKDLPNPHVQIKLFLLVSPEMGIAHKNLLLPGYPGKQSGEQDLYL